MNRAFAAAFFIVCFARVAAADLRGHLETLAACYPEGPVLVEGRGRAFARYQRDFDHGWSLMASAYADASAGTDERRAAGIVRPYEVYVERRGSRLEVRVGFSNIAWGVIDELAPQDLINPIDVSRFVLQDRSEARLPVPLARGRLFLPAELTIEGLVVPVARRGVFDQLDEEHSPFAPDGFDRLPRSDLEVTGSNIEGGLRVLGTLGRVDWGVSAYRDVVDFDRYSLTPTGLLATRPRRWMVGANGETARGAWVLRGEGAMFLDDPLQAVAAPTVITGRSYLAGIGADRRVGVTTIFLNAIYRAVPDDPRLPEGDEVTILTGLTRDFSQGTRTVRLFGLWNPSAGSAFVRALWNAELVENLRLELGGGAFLGEGGALVGSLDDADFVSARLRLYLGGRSPKSP